MNGETITQLMDTVAEAQGTPKRSPSLKPPVVTCRICVQPKGAANHWWLAQVSDAMLQRRILKIYEWDDQWAQALAYDSDLVALCGADCLHLALSRWTETRSFDPPAVRSEAHSPQSTQRNAEGGQI